MNDVELFALIKRVDPRAVRIPPGVRKLADEIERTAIAARSEPSASSSQEKAHAAPEIDANCIVEICDAHGIPLPIEYLHAVVEIVKFARNVDDAYVWQSSLPAASETVGSQTFQSRVQPWMMACFGAEISADCVERNHRFFEEATELVQACGMTASEAHQLVDYVYGRPVGERFQEVGGAMVTLAALCLAHGLNMHAAGEAELARISAPETVAKIRAKQAAKPKHSPLPVAAHDVQSPGADEAIRRLIELRHSQHARDHEIVAAIGALEKAIAAPTSSGIERQSAIKGETYGDAD